MRQAGAQEPKFKGSFKVALPEFAFRRGPFRPHPGRRPSTVDSCAQERDRSWQSREELRMNCKKILLPATAALLGVIALHAQAATSVLIGDSGKTYASSTVQCATNPATNLLAPFVEAGLFNPKRGATATVSLNGAPIASVTTADPAVDVWLADGDNTVVAALSKKTADSYAFTVPAGLCDNSGNTFSADGTLEFGASGKSYATVNPGCALNGPTGQTQPYINLFDNGGYLLNVSVNGVPLTQLSATRPHTPVFLSAGANVISAANGSLSTDYYVRDGGTGTCAL
jgi:hypothetical protein